MTTFAQAPRRDDAPTATATRLDDLAHLSTDDLQRCLGATEIARRVARDRGDVALVAELTARHHYRTRAFARRRSN
jgi:hypothetical protein